MKENVKAIKLDWIPSASRILLTALESYLIQILIFRYLYFFIILWISVCLIWINLLFSFFFRFGHKCKFYAVKNSWFNYILKNSFNYSFDCRKCVEWFLRLSSVYYFEKLFIDGNWQKSFRLRFHVYTSLILLTHLLITFTAYFKFKVSPCICKFTIFVLQ